MIIYPPAYLDKAGALARKHGVHLILDEVATGFGRTGKMFACEHAHAQPDFLCFSKGITSGTLPLGATLTTERVYRAFYADAAERKTFYHGHTYTANPIACAAALASLRIFEEEDTLARVRGLLPQFREGLERFRSLPIVGDVRQIGLIGAVELVKDRRTKEPFGARERIGLKIYREGLKRNLVLRPLGHIIYLFLPLCVRERELRFILDNAYAVLQAQCRGRRLRTS
jgi:adenosylmethionine-8-amino-7-oxononanoate aminotransferase